jgi:hypothetical protein
VPKLSAYQVRKGVIDFILRRFSLNEIAQGQAGEALQQVVKQVSQPYYDRMKSVLTKEVEQVIVTKLIMRCCQTIPDTPYASIVHPDVTLFMLTQEWLQNERHHIIRRWRRIYMKCCIFKRKKARPMDNNSTTVYGNSTDRGFSTAIYIMVSGRIPTEFTDSCAPSSESITSSSITTGHHHRTYEGIWYPCSQILRAQPKCHQEWTV